MDKLRQSSSLRFTALAPPQEGQVLVLRGPPPAHLRYLLEKVMEGQESDGVYYCGPNLPFDEVAYWKDYAAYERYLENAVWDLTDLPEALRPHELQQATYAVRSVGELGAGFRDNERFVVVFDDRGGVLGSYYVTDSWTMELDRV